MIDADTVLDDYHRITSLLIERHLSIASMESCSGGLIGVLLSDREGASEVVRGGDFTYTNEEKIACGVPAATIEAYGVYSAETASAMASACRSRHATDIGIGVTGSIGTVDPNNKDSVPGEVFIAIDIQGAVTYSKLTLAPASRWDSRFRIAEEAAQLLAARIGE